MWPPALDALDAAQSYGKWMEDRMFLMVPSQAFVRGYLESLREFPPVQGGLSINKVLESMMKNQEGQEARS